MRYELHKKRWFMASCFIGSLDDTWKEYYYAKSDAGV